jgi:hypothetical protein
MDSTVRATLGAMVALLLQVGVTVAEVATLPLITTAMSDTLLEAVEVLAPTIQPQVRLIAVTLGPMVRSGSLSLLLERRHLPTPGAVLLLLICMVTASLRV